MDLASLLTDVLREATGPTAIAYALAAIGLNVHFGLTGLINMGQAGFMLLGAYGFAISTIAGLPLVVAFLIAIAVAVVFDAFVVRMVLIPALLYLMHEKSWWLPGWLDRLLPEVDVEGENLHRPHLEDHYGAVAKESVEPVG